MQVFGFDYMIECYVPEAKRRYGYLPLQLLFRNRLVGRMHYTAHRAEELFENQDVVLEAEVTEAFLAALATSVADYAALTGCQDTVTLRP